MYTIFIVYMYIVYTIFINFVDNQKLFTRVLFLTLMQLRYQHCDPLDNIEKNLYLV